MSADILGIHQSLPARPRLPSPPRLQPIPVGDLLSRKKGSQGALPTGSEDIHAARNLKAVLKHLRKQGHDPDREDWILDVEKMAGAASVSHVLIVLPRSFPGPLGILIKNWFG